MFNRKTKNYKMGFSMALFCKFLSIRITSRKKQEAKTRISPKLVSVYIHTSFFYLLVSDLYFQVAAESRTVMVC